MRLRSLSAIFFRLSGLRCSNRGGDLMPEAVRQEPSRPYHWMVLIFVSVAMGGNYYIYESINSLERIFIERPGISATQFGRLNSSYIEAVVLTLLIVRIII